MIITAYLSTHISTAIQTYNPLIEFRIRVTNYVRMSIKERTHGNCMFQFLVSYIIVNTYEITRYNMSSGQWTVDSGQLT